MALVFSIGRHNPGIPDRERSVHHLVLVVRRAHRLFGAVLPAHQHADLGANSLFVKFNRLFGTAVEEQIGLHLHVSILLICSWFAAISQFQGTTVLDPFKRLTNTLISTYLPRVKPCHEKY